MLREYRSCDNTLGNAKYALMRRVFVGTDPWKPPKEITRVVNAAASRLGKFQLGSPLNREEVLEVFARYTAKKRDMYTEALEVQLHLPTHSKITAFVKDEFCEVKEGKEFKPRMIQFRDPVYLAHATYFYKPLEHAFVNGRYLFNRCQEFTCAKGMNLDRRMEVISECVRALKRPFVVDLDGSAFDAHVPREALKLEWSFYEKMARAAGWDRRVVDDIRRFGKFQLENRCFYRGKDGTMKYKVDGNRMSGDINTGTGNTVLMSVFIATFMAQMRVPDTEWRMLVDGDDSLLFVEAEWAERVRNQVSSFFSTVAQDVKAGQPLAVGLDSLEVVDFCQCRPVCVSGVWRLVRNPFRAINVYSRNSKWYRTQDLAEMYWRSITVGEKKLTHGVPILQSFYHCLAAVAGDGKTSEELMRQMYSQRNQVAEKTPEFSEVSISTRMSFWRAFGISPVSQTFIESFYDSLTIDTVWRGYTGIMNQ